MPRRGGSDRGPLVTRGGQSPGPGPRQRHRDWLVGSRRRGRALSALQLPFFLVLPPAGFGVLTTTGRRTGRQRRTCVRVIRSGDKAYLVAIGGARTGWLKNIRADPNVRLRIRDGFFEGVARELRTSTETQEALATYCETVNPFDHVECVVHGRGRPTQAKIEQLHRSWFEKGTALVVEL